MPRLSPPVARTRTAVRAVCADLPAGSLILVACSGGPDSMALAAACAFTAPRDGYRYGLITVDHQLQPGSGGQARRVADWARTAGFDPVELATVAVGSDGGPEAAARDSRYAALWEACDRLGAAALLLGHTRDDQAETVLLALSRGAGPHGLAAMPRRRGRLLRPLLDLPRSDTESACDAQDLPVWHDPHNSDVDYTRARVRAAMPTLTEALGEKLVANLARTASLVAQDNAALEQLADELLERARADDGLAVAELAAVPRGLRVRALRRWLRDRGVTGDLHHTQLLAMEALVSNWKGQKATQLPGGFSIVRRDGWLRLRHGRD